MGLDILTRWKKRFLGSTPANGSHALTLLSRSGRASSFGVHCSARSHEWRLSSPGVFAAWIVLCALEVFGQQQSVSKKTEDSNLRLGQKTFASTCAPCHGLDGRGGKTAPNIGRNTPAERVSDSELSRIVSHGIPGTGMPAFSSLDPQTVKALVYYLRLLQGQSQAQNVPGNPKNGETIFFGKAECSSCHILRGAGGFAGPDLTSYGADRSAKEIVEAIIHPSVTASSNHRIVTALTRDGTRLRGSVRNEDNFSLQLQTFDGSFHFLMKSDLKSLEYEEHSMMPADYATRLSRSELNDLAGFLMRTGREKKTTRLP